MSVPPSEATSHGRPMTPRGRRHGRSDRVSFFRNWLGRPLTTGAVAPSGRALARLMARHVDPAAEGPVLELGPGTGVVTRALIERGVAPERIVAVEYSGDFCRLIARRFPGVTVIRGDAYDLAGTLPPEHSGPFAAVVSGLPLMTRPAGQRRALIESALALTGENGAVIQFSYAPVPPVAAVAGRLAVERSRWVMRNLPPARVYVYRRIGS